MVVRGNTITVQGNTDANGLMTVNLSVTKNCNVVLIHIAASFTTDPDTVTVGGVSASLVEKTSSGSDTVWTYIAKNVPLGTQVVNVDWVNSQTTIVIGATEYGGVDQTNSINAQSEGTGTFAASGTFSRSVTTTKDNCIIVGVARYIGNSNGLQPNGGETEIFDLEQAGVQLQIQAESSGAAGSYSSDWQNSDTFWDGSYANHVIALAPVVYEQEGFRFRDDNGDEDGASWLANQDSDITRQVSVVTRLRALINVTGDPVSDQFRLDYKKSTDSLYRAIEYPAEDSISFGSAGAVVGGTTSLSVPHPTGIQPDDLLVLVIVNKYPTNAPTLPTGWVALSNNQANGGSGASGIDTGSVYTTIFVKIADGTESGNLAVTITSGNAARGRMFRYAKSKGMKWDLACAQGADNTAGTDWSVTGGSDPGMQAGDVVLVGSGTNTDAYSYKNQKITQTGVEYDPGVIEREDSGGSNGDDLALVVSEHRILSGTSSAAPIFTMTSQNTAANRPAGGSVFLRIRQVATPSIRAISAQAVGTTSLSLTIPTTAKEGDLLVMFISSKYPNNSPSTPTGWTAITNYQQSGSSGSNGIDTGAVYITMFVKECEPADIGATVSVTITSGNAAIGRIFAYSKRYGYLWDYAAVNGSDNTAGTSWSVTGGSDPGFAAGDLAVIGSGINTDGRTFSGHALTATGATFGSSGIDTPHERHDAGTTNGQDCGLLVVDIPCLSGPSSAAPTFTSTANGSATNDPAGASIILRLRQVQAPIQLADSSQIHSSRGAYVGSKVSAVVGTSVTHEVETGTKILIAILGNHQGTVTSADYGGQTLTKAVGAATGFNETAEIWYLLNPTVGSATLSAVFSGGSGRTIQGLNILGCRPIAPATTATNNGSSAQSSVSITPTRENSLIIDAMYAEADPTTLVNSNSVYLSILQGSSFENAATSKTFISSAGAISLGYNLTSGQRWAHCAIIIEAGEDTTVQLSAPSGKTTGDFNAGRISDDANPVSQLNLGNNKYTEIEWALKAISGLAQVGDVYNLRVTINGTVLDTYSVTPDWTIGTPFTTYTKTHTADSKLKKLGITKTYTADADLKGTVIKSHTTGAYLIPAPRKHTTDAKIVRWVYGGWSEIWNWSVAGTTITKTHTTDSFLKKPTTKTFTTNSLLKKALTKSHTVDSLLKKAATKNLLTDSLLKKAAIKSHTADSYLKKLGIVKNHTIDSLLKKALTKSHSTDTILKKAFTKNHTTDAYFKKLNITRTHTTDSKIKKLGITVFHTTDTDLKGLGLTKTHLTNAYIARTQSIQHTTNALLRKTQTKAHNTDSDLKKAVTQTHSTDSFIKKPTSKVHSIDALLRKTVTKSHSADALLKKIQTKTHSVDVYKKITVAKTHTTNSLFRKTQVTSHLTDADLKGFVIKIHLTNALLKKTLAIQHSTDARIKKLNNIKAHSIDALLKKTLTKTQTSDSLLRKTFTQSHFVNALLKKAASVQHFTNALFRKTVIKVHNTDADLKSAVVKTHSSDAYLKKTIVKVHSTDSRIKKLGTTVVHTADSLKYKTATLSHNIDSFIKKIQIKQHLTDSDLHGTATKTYSTDSMLFIKGLYYRNRTIFDSKTKLYNNQGSSQYNNSGKLYSRGNQLFDDKAT